MPTELKPFPSLVEDHFETSLDLNKKLILHPSATYFMQVLGEHMTDFGIYSNDLVIIDRSLEVFNNSIIVAEYSGEMIIRKFLKSSSIFINNHNELQSSDISSIFGVVTYVISQKY